MTYSESEKSYITLWQEEKSYHSYMREKNTTKEIHIQDAPLAHFSFQSCSKTDFLKILPSWQVFKSSQDPHLLLRQWNLLCKLWCWHFTFHNSHFSFFAKGKQLLFKVGKLKTDNYDQTTLHFWEKVSYDWTINQSNQPLNAFKLPPRAILPSEVMLTYISKM